MSREARADFPVCKRCRDSSQHLLNQFVAKLFTTRPPLSHGKLKKKERKRWYFIVLSLGKGALTLVWLFCFIFRAITSSSEATSAFSASIKKLTHPPQSLPGVALGVSCEVRQHQQHKASSPQGSRTATGEDFRASQDAPWDPLEWQGQTRTTCRFWDHTVQEDPTSEKKVAKEKKVAEK